MQISFSEKYSSLLNHNTKIDGQAEIINIGDKSFTVKLKGQCWKGRLVCWLKENMSLIFKRWSKTTASTEHASLAIQEFEKDVAGIEIMTVKDSKKISQKLGELKKAGLPLRVKHLRDLNQYLGRSSAPLSPLPTKITQRTGDTDELYGGNGLNRGNRNEDIVTVTVVGFELGTDDCKKALLQLSREPKNFYENHIQNKTNRTFAMAVDFVNYPERNVELHETWGALVSNEIQRKGLQRVGGSQLKRISDQAINTLSAEIEGSRKLLPGEIEGTGVNGESFYENASELIDQYNIKAKIRLSTNDIDKMRVNVLGKMEKTAISDRGRVLYARNAKGTFERAVIQHCSENPQLFSNPEDDWNSAS